MHLKYIPGVCQAPERAKALHGRLATNLAIFDSHAHLTCLRRVLELGSGLGHLGHGLARCS